MLAVVEGGEVSQDSGELFQICEAERLMNPYEEFTYLNRLVRMTCLSWAENREATVEFMKVLEMIAWTEPEKLDTVPKSAIGLL